MEGERKRCREGGTRGRGQEQREGLRKKKKKRKRCSRNWGSRWSERLSIT